MREKHVSRDGFEAPPAGDATRVAEHVFRREFGRMVAMLTGILGVQHLTLAEDAVQEALARALQIWPYRGVPENPSAWIMRVSRNLAMDVIRRETVFYEKRDQFVRLITSQHSDMSDKRISEDEIGDDASS